MKVSKWFLILVLIFWKEAFVSEFSQSYHYYNIDEKELLESINNKKIPGYYFGKVNNWNTIVPESEIKDIDSKLIEINKGILLHYIFMEDAGWQVSVYKSNKCISSYSCFWGEGFEISSGNLNIEKLMNEIGIKFTEDEINKIFFPKDFSQAYESQPSYSFMHKLNIKNYENVSYEMLKMIEANEVELFKELKVLKIQK